MTIVLVSTMAAMPSLRVSRTSRAMSEISYPNRIHHCQTCPRSFKRKDQLKRHVRTHTGERTYACDICNSAFARTDDLSRHKKKCLLKTRSRQRRMKPSGAAAPSYSALPAYVPAQDLHPPVAAESSTRMKADDSSPLVLPPTPKQVEDYMSFRTALSVPARQCTLVPEWSSILQYLH
eukprot:scpid90783/ scgid16460/ Transcription factor steA